MTTTTVLTVLTAVGAATFGGALFAFSAFVMHGLDRTPTRSAVEAMQHINLSAPRAPLVVVMIGTTGLAVATAVLSRSPLVVAGCAAFLASIAITGMFHIPRNNALADVDAAGPDAPAAWAAYSGPWQRGNHVRTAAALGGALLLMVSLTV
jgi:uncharacterized membrane protein